MGSISINGIQSGGTIHRLNAGAPVKHAQEAAAKDGLDQVFLKVKDQTLVLQGDGMNLKGLKEGSAENTVTLEIDGESVEAKVLSVDNETNTFFEGLDNDWSRAGAVATTAGAVFTAGSFFTGGGAVLGSGFTAGVALFTGASALVGGLYGGLRGSNHNLERFYLGQALNAQDLKTYSD